MAGPVLDPGIDEFLLEGARKLEPARLLKRRDRPAQELARAALPRAAVGVADIAEDEMLNWSADALAEIDAHLGRRVWHDHEIPAGAKRRIEDRAEAGLHQVGMGPADPRLAPPFELARREALAAHEPRDVAGAYECQLLMQHAILARSSG